MKKLKIVFMGTTDFGVPALEGLVKEGHEILGVIAQPDRPNQRGKKIAVLPLKEKALALGIEVLQPEKINEPEFIKKLRTYHADVFIVAAYGQMLSEEILSIPTYGAINIHGSLLPKYRGAAPIQRAIIDKEETTGVTIMQMSLGMDAGDMLKKGEIPITAFSTFGELYKTLGVLGGELLVETLEELQEKRLKPIPQNEEEATYAEKILKDTGHIRWEKTSREIAALLNGTDPQPGAYFFYDDIKIKGFSPKIVSTEKEASLGSILEADDINGLIIKTGDGAISLKEIQYPGKKRMAASVFLRGNSLEKGKILK